MCAIFDAALSRLTDQEKGQLVTKVRPHSMMDYLYRLRIKTNYLDSAMFTDGPSDNLSSSLDISRLLHFWSTDVRGVAWFNCTADV